MLAGEHGGRRDDGHLLPREGDGGGGAECDLGLAVADVGDDEPVHGPAAREVRQGLVDGAQLVGRLSERKAGDEAVVRGAGRDELGRDRHLAGPGEVDEAACGGGDLGEDGGAALDPALAVDAVEGDGALFSAVAPEAAISSTARSSLPSAA
jgi:hypothetical protein